MRWKIEESGNKMITRLLLVFAIMTISVCEGARRSAQRRKDTTRSSDLYSPTPSAESLQVIAQAMGAAGFEHYTEGRPLVKRLIPADSQPDLDLVEHQGVIGKAGVDFPAYPNIPNTGFNCKNVPTGYYADLETDCQVFHICDTSRKISFLCPNGTIFSQSHLICDWWFKVDCASAPALYESSAEYYSNEQKKTQKITQSLSKNSDLQQIGTDTNIRAESRRTSANIPTATERLLRHRQRLHSETPSNVKASSRSYQALFDNFNPTQRTRATTAFEKRKNNLVQLITNGFGNEPTKSTIATYTVAPSYRSTVSQIDHNNIKEMQVAAETASFANNNNRQFLQDYNNKNFRPYPVYTPSLTPRPSKIKVTPHLTPLYDIRDKTFDQVTQKTTTRSPFWSHESTTKRPTLMPYTKSYTSSIDKRDPYTRPGVSLLKDFLNKEKNKTLNSATEKIEITEKPIIKNSSNVENIVRIETKDTFESATKIPQTTRSQFTHSTEPVISISTSRSDILTKNNDYLPQVTTEAYQERRDRLIRKLNLETFNYGVTASTLPTPITEKFYGDLPNRPGLIVPPSLTPKTLHSLAIYYATALDNLSTNPPPDEETETTSPPFDEYGEKNLNDALPALFSKKTINKYSKLFGQGNNNAELLEEIKLDPNGTYNELAEDLSVQQSQNPIATSPQIRELAQVFTHALSAYLQDPVQFRKALSEIRPTHPTFGDMMTTEDSDNTEATTTVNEDDDEILGFSDDNKINRPSLLSLRDAKSLKPSTAYPTFVTNPTTSVPLTSQTFDNTETVPITYQTTTPRSPFRCCGRISASYTSASTSSIVSSTPTTFTDTLAAKINTTKGNQASITTTENSYTAPNYIGLYNDPPSNNSPYGQGVNPTGETKPLSEYIEATNLPTAWGVDLSDSTISPITNAHANSFESKKIKSTTTIPTTTAIYFTETDSIELENEEELQRAHSQSFLSPQDNSINNRHGKQINLEETKVKKPSEELEAPTLPDEETTTLQTTTQPPATTTVKTEEPEIVTTVAPNTGNLFTSADSEKITNEYQWASTFDSWPSTVIDPITLNDGLSQTNPEEVAEVAKQTNSWEANTAITTAEPKYKITDEQTVSPSTHVIVTTPSSINEERLSRYLRDPTSTEPNQDISAITDTVVEKAKEIMGGMNATTTEKLMNVMKKTKSKTVKRLILLLVQTCDDDHNTTAEASKRALLEALMAVSQRDMDEIAKQELEEIPITTVDYESVSTDVKRADRRRPKSFNSEASAINSLSNPTTTENIKTTTEPVTEPATTTLSTTRQAIRRGAKKFQTKSTPLDSRVTRAPFIDVPIAEARIAPHGSELKGASDTRALELLKSLYTIAARWG